MSIYTAIVAAGGKPSIPFQERELNMTACRASEAGIYPIPSKVPIHYTLGIQNLHKLLYAKYKLGACHVNTSTMNDAFRHISAHSISPPPVLCVTAGGDDDEAMKSYGMMKIDQGRKNFWGGSPSIENFRSIVKVIGGVKDEQTPAGNVSCVGFLAHNMAWKAVGAFCSLSRGLAVEGKSIPVTVEGHKEIKFRTGMKVEVGGIKGGVRMEVGGAADIDHTMMTISDLVLVPIPIAGIDLSAYSYTSKERLPGPGHVFPYFHGLLTPDRDLVGDVFFRYFGNCIAGSTEDFARLAGLLRRGFRNLQSCRQGLELQHIFYGIDMAVRLGGQFALISEGREYRGFAVVRTEGSILDKNVVRPALSTEDIKKEVDKLRVHERALAKIKTILDGIPDVSGVATEMDIELYRLSARRLAEFIYTKDTSLLSDDDKTALRDAIEETVYAQTYWEITPENLMKLLRALVHNKWFDADAPYYLYRGVALSTDPVTRALAAFGPDAPSCFQGDERRTISKPGVDDPNLVKTDGRRTRLPYIPIYRVPILTAATHWKSVQSRGEIRFKPPRAKKPEFTNRTAMQFAVEGDHFDAFYTLLREYVAGKTIATRTQKGKRGADQMDLDDTATDTGDSVAKKARLDFDLF